MYNEVLLVISNCIVMTHTNSYLSCILLLLLLHPYIQLELQTYQLNSHKTALIIFFLLLL